MLRRINLSLAVLLIVGFTAYAVCAQNKDVTILDPAQAGPDYEVQGEYVPADPGAESERHCAQIIALGDGKFQAVHYVGGLPGDGWKRGDVVEKADGATQDGVTVFKHEKWTATVKNGVLTATDPSGKLLGTLKKVERKSPTLGAKPPAGAKVLFDGTSAEQFSNGKMTDDGLLMADCFTQEKFGDHSLHIEFRTPFKPFARGQARGNSGVYVQGRYEVQVLDSFGLDGKNNECGGIYSIAEPKVNMCFPPLTWQTYDIDFTAAKYEGDKKVKNARVTIKHNGVVIHDDLELPHGTPGRHNEGPGPDELYLQGHGNPVVFRNIWLVEKK